MSKKDEDEGSGGGGGKQKWYGAGKMAQWVKVLTEKAAVLSLVPGCCGRRGESLAVGVWTVARPRTLWLSFGKSWGHDPWQLCLLGWLDPS